MNILITGGAGFIGSHLCDALIERGDEVWCVDNLHLGRLENIEHLREHPRFHFHKLDVLHRDVLDCLFAEAHFDAVFHLAANSDISRGSDDHSLDLRLTFLTTVEVLEAMFRHGVKRLLFASTSAVFGDSRELLRETTGPLQPVSFYGASKLASEAFVSVFARSFGIKTCVLRFPNVVGERCTHGAVYDFITRLQKDAGSLRVLGDGTQTKPYLYVKDLVAAMLLAFDKSPEQLGVYHVAGEGMTTVREIAEMVLEEMGLQTTPIEYTGGKIGWVGDVPYFNYEAQKIRGLGFSPRHDSNGAVREAIRKILDT